MVHPGCDPVGAVERQAYAAAVLVDRMVRSDVAPAPIWDDLESFDGRPFRGRVDLVTAGYPCQPESVAGKRRGRDDERWLWHEVWRVVRDVGAGLLFVENVPGHLTGTFHRVLGDLAAGGWAAEWDCVPAAAVGAPHLRDRFFLLAAHPDRLRVRVEPERDQRGRGGEREAECWTAVPRDGREVGAPDRGDRGWPPASAADAGGQRLQADAGAGRAPGPRDRDAPRGGGAAQAPGHPADPDRAGLDQHGDGDQLDPGERATQRRDPRGRRGPRARHPEPRSDLSAAARAQLAAIEADGRSWWSWDRAPEPCVRGVDDGVLAGVDGSRDDRAERLHALGNAVVRHAAAAAFVVLWDRLTAES